MSIKDIRNLSIQELSDFFQSKGEKTFRAKQVNEWLWKKSATDFDSMTNLPVSTREELKKSFCINNLRIHRQQSSIDGTIKSAFRLYDGNLVEGVLIPTDHRLTACISSQVGCSLTCKFCATGYLERKRNLDAGEIYDQVVIIGQQAMEIFEKPLTNIVYMGMGEPLLNYKNVLQSIKVITSPQGLGVSSQRITVSTAGIANMIRKLGDDNVRFNLALSLHAADDKKRDQIMPINETNSLKAVLEALQYYYTSTKNPVTFEYILFKDFNDGLEDAKKLIKIIRRIPSKVNIIEYNPISNADFRKAESIKTNKFRDYLDKNGVNARIRRSRGKDIDAACGQLANKSNVNPGI